MSIEGSHPDRFGEIPGSDDTTSTPGTESRALALPDRVDLVLRALERFGEEPAEPKWFSAAPKPRPRLFNRYWRALGMYKWIIAGVTAASALCGLGYVALQAPSYQAHTLIGTVDYEVNGTGDAQAELLENRTLRERTAGKIVAARPDWTRLIQKTAEGVSVRTKPEHGLVEISCSSPNPQLAAQYANVLAKEFIDERFATRVLGGQPAYAWIEQRLDRLRDEIDGAEKQMGMPAGPESGVAQGVSDQTLRELEKQYALVQLEDNARRAKLEISRHAPPESLPEVFDDDAIKADNRNLADLKRQLAGLKASFAPEYPQIHRIEAQISETEAEISRRAALIVDRLRGDAEVATARENSLARYIRDQKAHMADKTGSARNAALERRRKTYLDLYTALALRLQDAQVSTLLRSSFVVIDPASPPNEVIRGNVTNAPLTAMFIGFFGSVAFVFIRTAQDPTFVVLKGMRNQVGGFRRSSRGRFQS